MLKYTSLTVHDLGLGKGTDLKKTIITDGFLTAVILLAMILVKLFIQRIRPDIIAPDAPLFYWNNWELSSTLYPITVFAQELMTRGAAQGCLSMVLPEKTPNWVPIIISSLFFGAMHIHKDLIFMIGAMILLSFLVSSTTNRKPSGVYVYLITSSACLLRSYGVLKPDQLITIFSIRATSLLYFSC